MDKSVVALLGVAGAFAAGSAGAAPASPVMLDQVMQARSYSELLKPIPNALALLRLRPEAPPAEATTAPVREVEYHHHHHHHHHRRHHHHHHHHHGLPF